MANDRHPPPGVGDRLQALRELYVAESDADARARLARERGNEAAVPISARIFVMSRALPQVSRKSRTTVRAARTKKVDKTLIFTKTDMARQYKAAQRFLALSTVTVGDPKVSETGVLLKPRGSAR